MPTGGGPSRGSLRGTRDAAWPALVVVVVVLLLASPERKFENMWIILKQVFEKRVDNVGTDLK
jgi:hypothetical protein